MLEPIPAVLARYFLHVMVYSAQMVGFSETSCFRNRLKAVYLVANADSYFIFKIYLKSASKLGRSISNHCGSSVRPSLIYPKYFYGLKFGHL